MINIPEKLISISGNSKICIENKTINFTYIINEGTEEEVYIPVILTEFMRPSISFDIIFESKEFVNGFKVVQTANKEYAYIREEDNTLLPYRYDVATQFNEYGYAMVGKNGKVSWINKNFEYLNVNGEMTLKDNNDYVNFNGFVRINNFSKGEIPLSKVSCDGYNLAVKYFGTDGKFKKFYEYDGEKVSKENPIDSFSYYSADFSASGYATVNEGKAILLSTGFILSTKNLIKICDEEGFFNSINYKIERRKIRYKDSLNDEDKTKKYVKK